jgi:hypothetical protein
MTARRSESNGVGRSASPEPPSVPDENSGDRSTIVPEFDPEDFARGSEIKQRAAITDGGEPTIDQARRHHVAGEHEKALFLLTRLLDLAPLHPEGRSLASDCRQALERECLAAIGSESAILVVAVSQEELKAFSGSATCVASSNAGSSSSSQARGPGRFMAPSDGLSSNEARARLEKSGHVEAAVAAMGRPCALPCS